MIGLMNIRKEWEESLPQTVNIHYCYDEKVLASFYDANVVGKEDIRNQAQSLGRELVGGWLELTTNNILKGYEIVKHSQTKKYAKRWLYVMRLNEIPDFFNENYQYKLKDSTEKILEHSGLKPYLIYTIDLSSSTKEAIKGHIIYSDKYLLKIENDEVVYNQKLNTLNPSHDFNWFKKKKIASQISSNYYIKKFDPEKNKKA